MPSPISFTAPSLSLSSVQQTGLSLVQVTFSGPPTSSSPAGAHDALNPSNYSITGPSIVQIQQINPTSNTSIFNVALKNPLNPGTYTLSISNIQAINGSGLVPPTTYVFNATLVTGQGSANGGATNDLAEDIFRKHFSSAFVGPNWDGLIYAFTRGDQYNFDCVRLAYDQKFKISASGIYLDRLASNEGLLRPPKVGMSDDLFRQYSIIFATGQLIQSSLLQLAEVFYGQDALRAYAQTANAEPYALSDQLTLNLLLEEETSVQVVFSAADFGLISSASAIEVVAAINRWLIAKDYFATASVFTNPLNGLNYVRIYSSALGLSSSVRITGGSAQNILQFPTLINTQASIGQTWTVAKEVFPVSPAGTVRYTIIGNSTGIDLTQIRVGCYANIYGAGFFAANRGSFPITKVGVYYPGTPTPGVTLNQYFEVYNPNGVNQATVTTLALNDVLFFYPTKESISNGSRTVVIASPNPNEINMVIPATTDAVSRVPGVAAYLQPVPTVTATSVTRSTSGLVTVYAPAHGLAVNQQILVDGVVTAATPPTETVVTPGSGGSSGSTSYSLGSIWAPTSALSSTSSQAFWENQGTVLPNGDFFVFGGAYIATSGGSETATNITKRFQITGSTNTNAGIQYNYAWVNSASMSLATIRHKACLMNTNQVFCCGGYISTNTTINAEIYDPIANTWTNTGFLNTARASHAVTPLNNGNIFISGGISTTSTAVNELYNPLTKVCTTTTSLVYARSNHRATLLNSGKVLITGGRSIVSSGTLAAESSGTPLFTCEVYDPAGPTCVQVGNMAYARTGHTATLLSDGRVMVIGGWGVPANVPGATAGPIAAIEVFDPNYGSWSTIGSINNPRWNHHEKLLPSGKVLVFGGAGSANNNGSLVAQSEYIDTNTFKVTNTLQSLQVPVAGGVSALVDGIPVLIGGYGVNGTVGTGQVYIQAADTIGSGRFNTFGTIISLGNPAMGYTNTANYFNYQNNTNLYGASASGVITPFKAQAHQANVPGPYIFDSKKGLDLSSISTILGQPLYANVNYPQIQVNNVSSFPNTPGTLVIGFGYDYQTVINYQSAVQENTFGLFLTNASQVLTKDIPIVDVLGNPTTVIYIPQAGPFVPTNTNTLGAFYLTASNAGLAAAKDALINASGVGLGLNLSVTYPGDRGLGNQGYPVSGQSKLADLLGIFGSDNEDQDYIDARGAT